MTLPIQLISTDFDGTLHAEAEDPPVPLELQALIGQLQEQGVKWMINTGRDLSSLMEALARAHLSIWPDFVVVVEREIYCRKGTQYLGLETWNQSCTQAHHQLFARVRLDLPKLVGWVKDRFAATIYEDSYSPFCLLAASNDEADQIHAYLDQYCQQVPCLTVVRNDVYARFSHRDFNKGTALAEVARLLEIAPERIFAAGDHLNDLPMLSQAYARWLVAPFNAVEAVKEAVRQQNGYVSYQPFGNGVTRGLEFFLGLPKSSLANNVGPKNKAF